MSRARTSSPNRPAAKATDQPLRSVPKPFVPARKAGQALVRMTASTAATASSLVARCAATAFSGGVGHRVGGGGEQGWSGAEGVGAWEVGVAEVGDGRRRCDVDAVRRVDPELPLQCDRGVG